MENPTISAETFKFLLRSDASYIVSLILENNPFGVIANLNNLGYTNVSDENSAFEQLNELAISGDINILIEALSVEFLPENLPSQYHAGIYEVAQENLKQPTLKFQFLGQEMGATNILGAVAGALNGLTGAGSNGLNRPVMQTNGFTNNGLNTVPTNRSNTTVWIVVAVVIIAVLFFVFRK